MGDYRARVKPDGTVEIPSELRQVAGIEPGDEVVLRADNAGIRVSALPAPDAGEAASRTPIWVIAEAIGRSIPPAEWDRLPPDIAINLDRYLYGKRPARNP